MAKTTRKTTVNLVEQAARAGAEAALAASDERAGGFPSSGTEEGLANREEQAPLTQEEIDVFGYADKYVEESGHEVKFYVHKNGEQLTVLQFPASWEQIQEQFGGGRFKVQMKDLNTGFFKRQEQRTLASPAQPQGPVFSADAPVESTAPPQTEYLAYMERMEERRREETKLDEERRREERAREDEKRELRDREGKESQKNLFATIATLAGPIIAKLLEPKVQDDSKLTLMLEFMREQSRAQADTTKAVLERVERLSEGTKDKGITPGEQMKMLRDAEKDGFDRAKVMFEMIDEKAESRAETMTSSKGDGEDSLANVLIKSLAPAIGPALAQMAVPRASLPQAQPENVVQLRPEQAIEVGTEHPGPNRSNEPVAANVSQVPRSRVPSTREVLASEGGNKVGFLKAKIEEIATPLIGKRIVVMAQTNEAYPVHLMSHEIIEACKAQGISQEMLMVTFTHADLMALTVKHKLPNQLVPWFNSLYASLNPQFRLDAAQG